MVGYQNQFARTVNEVPRFALGDDVEHRLRRDVAKVQLKLLERNGEEVESSLCVTTRLHIIEESHTEEDRIIDCETSAQQSLGGMRRPRLPIELPPKRGTGFSYTQAQRRPSSSKGMAAKRYRHRLTSP